MIENRFSGARGQLEAGFLVQMWKCKFSHEFMKKHMSSCEILII